MAKLVDFLNRILPFKKADSITLETVFSDLEDELKCKEMAFYIATSYIANTISKCEFKVYKNNKEVKDSLYYKLNVKSNPNETASRLKNKLIYNLYYNGESLIFDYNSNLYCADSFNKKNYPLKGDKFEDIELSDQELKAFNKKRDDVFYFNLENNEQNSKVKGLITSMYEDYKKILQYAVLSYKQSNTEKYTLELSNTQTGDKEFNKKWQEQVKEYLQDFIDNPKSVMPIFNGQKLTPVSNKNNNATNSEDIRNIKKDIMETVAEAFKMPVSMLYGNMTNVKDIISHYLTFTIDPIATMISQEITSNSFSIEDWQKGNYVKVDTSKINHLDIFEISDKIEKLVSSGVFSINGVLEKLGEPKLEEEYADKHFITKNYSEIEEYLKELKGGE